MRLAEEEIVSIDVEVGDGAEGITARLIVPRRFAHVAYAGQKLFKPTTTDNPTYQVVMFFDEEFERNKSKPLPQKDITIRLAHAADGRLVKFVRNSNYFGEWKKGVFAGENYRAKLKGDAIFLHAGCRKDTLENRHGAYVTSYSLFVALSANGKTSTTCKVLARKGHERSWLIQDDGGTLCRDGRFRGFEAGGLFIKTDCLNPGEQIGKPTMPASARTRSWRTSPSAKTAASTSTTWPAPATAGRWSNAATSCTPPTTSTPSGSTTCFSSPAATSFRPSPS